MNKYLKKIMAASALLGLVFTIILLLFQRQYQYALILFVLSWAVLFVAGAYCVPAYVKMIILKYLDTNNGKASKDDIIQYCSSKNRYYLKEAVEVWLDELETKRKVKIENGMVLKKVAV